MPKAYAQNGELSGQLLHHINADAGILGSSGTGTEDYMRRLHGSDLFYGLGIISYDTDVRIDLSNKLEQII